MGASPSSSSPQGDTLQPGSSNKVAAPQSPHYTNYDTISCIQDVPSSPDARSSARFVAGDAAFFTGCIIFSLLGGFGLNLILNSKKYREGLAINNSSKQEVPKHTPPGAKVVLEDPMVLATRALGWGTLFAIVGSGAVGLTTAYILKT